MDNTLLPCPFCGGIGTLWSIDQCDTVYAVCQDCGARTVDYKHAEDAIAAWNRRAEPELTRCEKCDYWDKSASFMSAHACAFWSSGKKTRYTENYEFCSFAERKEEHIETY